MEGERDHSLVRERVALMRELGMVQWGDIVLGPPPTPKDKAQSKLERARTQEERDDASREIEAEAKREAESARVDELRLQLASSRPDISDAELRQMLGLAP